MNLVDIILLLIIIYAFTRGYFKGIFSQINGIAGVLIGVWTARQFSETIADMLEINTSNEIWVFVSVLIIVMIGVVILTNLIEKLFNVVGVSFVVKILGGALGVLKYLVIMALILSCYISLVTNFNLPKSTTIQQSIAYKPLMGIGNMIFPYIHKLINVIYTPDMEQKIDRKIEEKIDELMDIKKRELLGG